MIICDYKKGRISGRFDLDNPDDKRIFIRIFENLCQDSMPYKSDNKICSQCNDVIRNSGTCYRGGW